MSWMVENCIWSLVPFPRAVVYSKAVNKGLFFQRLQSGVGNSIEFPIFAYLKKGFMSVTTIRLGHSSRACPPPLLLESTDFHIH